MEVTLVSQPSVDRRFVRLIGEGGIGGVIGAAGLLGTFWIRFGPPRDRQGGDGLVIGVCSCCSVLVIICFCSLVGRIVDLGLCCLFAH